MLQTPASRIARWLRRLDHALFRIEIWNIGVVEVSAAELLRGAALGPVRWARLSPNPRLRADPVFWQASDGLRILYEELPLLGGKAGIRSVPVADMDAGGRARVEIERPTHLSYPLLVDDDDGTYCVPESAFSNGVDLYRWDVGRGAWGVPQRIIDGVPIIDPTIIRRPDGWYMLGSLLGPTIGTRLHVWQAPQLHGPWRPHTGGPFVSTQGTARGAGPLFTVDGQLFRPSQEARGGYGSALCINRVEQLDAQDFREIEVMRLRPDPQCPYPHGLHTLAFHGNLAVIDGKCYQRHPLAALSKMLWWLRTYEVAANQTNENASM